MKGFPLREIWLLSALTLLGAACLFFYGILVWRVLRADKPALLWRLCVFVPPVSPVVAWVANCRVELILWLVLLVAYGILRWVSV